MLLHILPHLHCSLLLIGLVVLRVALDSLGPQLLLLVETLKNFTDVLVSFFLDMGPVSQ